MAETDFQKRVGRCYQLSAEYVLYKASLIDPDALLVHGTIQRNPNPRIDHAWVLFSDGQVFDPVAGLGFQADAYCRWANALSEISYTRDQVARLINDTEHWGPWHRPLK